MRSEGLMKRSERNINNDVSIEESKKKLQESVLIVFEAIKRNEIRYTRKKMNHL